MDEGYLIGADVLSVLRRLYCLGVMLELLMRWLGLLRLLLNLMLHRAEMLRIWSRL
jgi:hypothetical protein